MKQWLYLGIAIISETIATSALKSSEGFPGCYHRYWWWPAMASPSISCR